MSQPAAKERGSASPAPTRHDQDLYTWVQEQVGLLRARRFDEIDAENVAEELADVGRSEFAKIQSALEVLLTHMLKWDHQPEKRTRSWDNTIAAQRGQFENILGDNPGLKSKREEALRRAYKQARLHASSETGLIRSTFPESCPYTWEDILSRPFDYDPPAPVRTGRRR